MSDNLADRVTELENKLNALLSVGVMTIKDNVQIFDGRTFQVGKVYGTKFGTETTQKISFHGVPAVVQAAAISPPSGGTTVDSQARTAISALITALHNKGLIG